jgi:hypothetical protein
MKLATILLASAFALSGTSAFSQAGGANGTAGGPTTLSGTGTSTMGGDTAGAVPSNPPPAGGSMSGGTTGSATGNQGYGNPNGTAGGPTSLSGTGSSQFGGSVSGNTGKKLRESSRKNPCICGAMRAAQLLSGAAYLQVVTHTDSSSRYSALRENFSCPFAA